LLIGFRFYALAGLLASLRDVRRFAAEFQGKHLSWNITRIRNPALVRFSGDYPIFMV
jgi:hypothetical protein